MTKALSRNLRGLDYDTREAARAAARRSGKSLGDWLDDAIREKADELPEEDFDSDEDGDGDRLDAAARRLARSRREPEPPRETRRWRDDAEDRREASQRCQSRREPEFDHEPRHKEPRGGAHRGRERRDWESEGDAPRRWRDEEPPRIDPRAIVDDAAAIVEKRLAESERQTARALDNLAGLIKRSQRRDDGADVKKVIAAFAQRTEESERQTAHALNDIAAVLENGQRERDAAESGIAALADRLGRIESRLSEQPGANATVRPIRSALARLESRLDKLSSEDRTADFEDALSGLDKRLADIARRLDEDAREREERERQARLAPVAPPAPAAPQPVAPALDMNGASAAALEQGLRRVEPRTRRPLVDAIAEITQRQRILDEDIVRASAPIPAPAPEPDVWGGEPPAQRFASLQATLDAIAQQLDTVRQDSGERADQQMVVMRQVEGLRREVEDMSRAIDDLAPRASVAAVETALRDLAHRIESQRHRGVADDLLAPAERIAGELRAVIRELDPSPIVRNLHADVETIGRRLDAMQASNPDDSIALRELSLQTRELSEQTHEIKQQLSALAARPLPLEKLETRLFDLSQRVDALALAHSNASKAAAALDMGELVRAIRAIVAAETGSGFETFNHRLDQLAGKLDDAVARVGGKRFDELGERIDALGKSLAQRIDKSAAQQKPVDTGPLEQLVAKLAKKIDSALDHKSHAPAFEEIGRKIERLETRFADPAPKESIARIEAMLAKPVADRQFAELAQRIDLVHKTLAQRLEQGVGPSEAADVRYIEELVRGLDQKIETALEAGVRQPELQAIENQIGQLSRKIDRLEDPTANPKLGALLARPQHNPQLDDISDRLERMQLALAQRAEEGARVEARQSDLAALVSELADRMNQALDPRDDTAALKALESQIGALSQRLDRNDHNGAALAAIESKIGGLVAQIEDARTATTLAAEEAVRRATQDILREASSADPSALRAAVERELTDIRKTQDESGQRTHETLLAVHETLERVVDRLAMFEDELSEIRSAPAPASVAAPAAPAPSPAPEPVTATRRRAEDWPAVNSPRQPNARLIAEPVAPAAEPRRGRVETSDDEDLMDFLLPPGGGGGRREPPLSAPASVEEEEEDVAPVGPRSVQSDFIAAARRAAQQAALDASAAESQHARRAAARARVDAPEAREGGKIAKFGSIGAAIQERKRPLLLGLGAIVLLIGAYQIARVSIQGVDNGASTHQEHQEAEAAAPAPTTADAAPKAEAPETPAAPVATPKDAPPPRMISPPQATDPTKPQTRGAPPRMISPPRAEDSSPAQTPAGAASLETPVDPTPTGAISPAPVNPLSATDATNAIKALAAGGDAAAQYEMGVRYADGRGVGRDARTAAQWFEKAAAQGLAPAQYRLGSLYEKGVGVERDFASARKWYQSAADAGNARAMHNLAVLVAEGGDGKPDYTAAAQWFRKAAEFGVRDSQFNLAILYARGLGVEQNLIQSYLWFAAAAQQGDADAGKKRDEVGARLDSKELATAKALAEGFHAREPIRDANDVLPPKLGGQAVKDPVKAPVKPGAKAKVSQI
ncbi:SEL1-like repeat protein [Methylocystis sp. ATCC 49242]|uniref:SEL1-like repeat protein n=1 Tax=Methylocystis sp. ATCC 49242 TaxID=622637 RepID=UPI0001F86CAC|nr:SEL1-like repeat protein [Methylocystis sp. ATCC 49242]